MNVDMVSLPGFEGALACKSKVNRHFAQNPTVILGKQGGFGAQRFRGQCAVVPIEGENLADAFAEAVKQLPAGIWVHPSWAKAQTASITSTLWMVVSRVPYTRLLVR